MDSQGLHAVEHWNSRAERRYETIEVRPITHTIGAEIVGVDLSRDIPEPQFKEIRQAWLDHLVVIFRNQKMTTEEHKRFGRRFGKLHVHPLHELIDDLDPEILEIKALPGAKKVPGEVWHTDVSCDAEPPMASMLYITKMPKGEIGGDTMFANMYLAYDMLSDRLKNLLEGATAVHDGNLPFVLNGVFKAPEKGFPRSEHPVVARHPETGKRLLYVNKGFTSHIVQLAAAESRFILNMLHEMILVNPQLICRIPWTPNSMILWDNRCTQHHSIWDYYPYERYGQRVTIVGSPPRA